MDLSSKSIQELSDLKNRIELEIHKKTKDFLDSTPLEQFREKYKDYIKIETKKLNIESNITQTATVHNSCLNGFILESYMEMFDFDYNIEILESNIDPKTAIKVLRDSSLDKLFDKTFYQEAFIEYKRLKSKYGY